MLSVKNNKIYAQQDNVQRTRSLSSAISNDLQDIGIQIYLCHDFDPSVSRDVTGHVTIRFVIYHFIYHFVYWCPIGRNWASIFNGFRDIWHKNPSI